MAKKEYTAPRFRIPEDVYHKGGHFYDRSPFGKKESAERNQAALTYQPGDRLRVDYAFGLALPDLDPPANTEVTFVKWEEYYFGKKNPNLANLGPDAKPGYYTSYGRFEATTDDGKTVSVNTRDAVLVDETLKAERLAAVGDQTPPKGFLFVRTAE